MYAVAIGREQGIFFSWSDVQKQVKGYSGAKYQKVETEEEGLDFIRENSLVSFSNLEQFEQPIIKANSYFNSPLQRLEVTDELYFYTSKAIQRDQVDISDLGTVYYKTLENRINKFNPINRYSLTTTVLTKTDKDMVVPLTPEGKLKGKHRIHSMTEKGIKNYRLSLHVLGMLTAVLSQYKPDKDDVLHIYTNSFYVYSILTENQLTKETIAKEVRYSSELKILYRLVERLKCLYVSYIPQGPSPEAFKIAKKISTKLNKV